MNFSVGFLKDWLIWPPCYSKVSQESSPAPQFKGINSSALSLFYCPALISIHQFSAGAQCLWLFVTPLTAACQGPCPSPTPRVHANPCPLSQWCHPTISFSVIPFSSCLQSYPESGSSLMSQFFTSGGLSIEGSASAISPSNEYSGLISFRVDWFN